MQIYAKAPRNGCMSDGCRLLEIKTDDPEQQKFLTALHDFFVRGGEAVVKPKGAPMSILLSKGMTQFTKPKTTKNERNRKTTRLQPRVR